MEMYTTLKEMHNYNTVLSLSQDIKTWIQQSAFGMSRKASVIFATPRLHQ